MALSAETGSGKTLAYLTPILSQLEADPSPPGYAYAAQTQAKPTCAHTDTWWLLLD